MTRFTVFHTPGLIPIEAFTHFGVNAKPNSQNPIGFFGTGLKYAIAVLVREQIPVTLWIGRHKYVFVASEEDFRGKDFTFITLKRSKGTFWTKTALPFTTELGKNWKLWQAFRELYANTLDEGGNMVVTPYQNDVDMVPLNDCTKIMVESDEFAEVAKNYDKYFLPDAAKQLKLFGSSYVEVIKKPADAIYYRSMRVFELPKGYPRSIYTYNITAPMQLTEDRTLAAPYMADYYIKNAIVGGADEDMLENVLRASKETYEGHLDFDGLDTLPSDTFKKVYRGSVPVKEGYVYSRMKSYMSRVAPETPPSYVTSFPDLIGHLRKMVEAEDWYEMERFMRLNVAAVTRALTKAENALREEKED